MELYMERFTQMEINNNDTVRSATTYSKCKDPLLIGEKTHAQIAYTPIRDINNIYMY